MSRKRDVRAAQHAKVALASRFGDRPWFRGVAIVPTDDGELAIRVSIASADRCSAAEVPDQVDGVPVKVLFIDGYKPRSVPGRGETA